jgi:hypothetical protein
VYAVWDVWALHASCARCVKPFGSPGEVEYLVTWNVLLPPTEPIGARERGPVNQPVWGGTRRGLLVDNISLHSVYDTTKCTRDGDMLTAGGAVGLLGGGRGEGSIWRTAPLDHDWGYSGVLRA